MSVTQIMAFVEGTISTLQLTLISMVLGTGLGMVMALGRISKNKLINKLTWVYVWIFRGTPLLLQIIIVFLAIPMIAVEFFDVVIRYKPFTAAIIALTLNTAAYLAEIFRAGILSIDKGQLEASKALGMTRQQAMFKVIIPQTISRVIPPYSNEFIMILKDTSLVSAIGMSELYKVGKELQSTTGDWRVLFIAAGIYLFLTTISTYIFGRLEKKYSEYL